MIGPNTRSLKPLEECPARHRASSGTCSASAASRCGTKICFEGARGAKVASSVPCTSNSCYFAEGFCCYIPLFSGAIRTSAGVGFHVACYVIACVGRTEWLFTQESTNMLSCPLRWKLRCCRLVHFLCFTCPVPGASLQSDT